MVPWRKEEEEKLSKVWVLTSQYLTEWDSQTFNCLWEKVGSALYALMGSESGNPDQISSKLRDLRLKRTEFGRIYNNLKNLQKSKSNDFDKTTLTHEVFPYVKSWLKVKDAPKWKELTEGISQISSNSNRSINYDVTSQQSDGRTHTDINDDLIDLEEDQHFRRSVGRNKEKKNRSVGFRI
uniref:No apical meristem-associated C-terminal domain-containing protein n=1 Tax=Lactuca sativa TaxID=4236 RepID=A0A9R1UK47_LACSA|nr:hypothetical protein LSAT_V11C900497270 [Lactuca sativa]